MNQLARLRHDRGLSQQELADKLNTTAVSIGRYEREDQRLTLPLLRRLAKVLDSSIAEIAGEAGSGAEHLAVPVYDLRAAAGAGALAADAPATEHLMFREPWLRRIAHDLAQLFVLEISGDSMWETLHDGIACKLGADGSTHPRASTVATHQIACRERHRLAAI